MTLPSRAAYQDRLTNPKLVDRLEKVRSLAQDPKTEGLGLMAKRRRDALSKGLNNGARNHGILALALRHVEGGRQTFVGLLDQAALNQDPDAKNFMFVFNELTVIQQDRVALEDVCEASGLSPDGAMAIVVSTAMRMNADVGDLVAAVTHPSIVRAAAKSAKRIGGAHAAIAQKDRELLFQHHRFVPSKAPGVSVNVKANAQAGAVAASQPSVPTFRESLTGAADAQRDVQDDFTKRVEGVVVDPEDAGGGPSTTLL